MSSNDERRKELRSRQIKIQLLEAPGAIIMGLGLYAEFSAEGKAFHPVLNDSNVVLGLLIVGGAIMAWGAYKTFLIAREMAALQKRD
ncbi:MAG: hypothetical protein V2I33_05550 [Kangiellaceae bacterium]|nr:hypothetical protein [Kangiellaceae bacterium]